MKSFTAAAAIAMTAAVSASSIEKRDASTPITIQGNAFFQGNNRFYIRGVDYQPGKHSPLLASVRRNKVQNQSTENRQANVLFSSFQVVHPMLLIPSPTLLHPPASETSRTLSISASTLSVSTRLTTPPATTNA
jgi:Glucanosyltransferase